MCLHFRSFPFVFSFSFPLLLKRAPPPFPSPSPSPLATADTHAPKEGGQETGTGEREDRDDRGGEKEERGQKIGSILC